MDEDFIQLAQELTLPSGESQVTVSVSLEPDSGGNKVFEVYLGPAPGAFVTPIAFANVTITDSDLPCEWYFTLCIIITKHGSTWYTSIYKKSFLLNEGGYRDGKL